MRVKQVIREVENLKTNGEGYITEEGEKLLQLLTDSDIQNLIVIR